MTIQIGAVRARELRTAFHLMYQHLSDSERFRCAARSLQLVNEGELGLDDILAARENGVVRGMLVCCFNPGGSSQIWPPQVVEGPNRLEIEDELLKQGLKRLNNRGAKFAQVLLPAEDACLTPTLLRNCFRNVTYLLVMSHSLELNEPTVMRGDSHEDCAFETLCPSNHSVFAQTLEQTYLGTYDFPELNGIRTVDEIMVGHKSHGVFDARRWLLLKRSNKPAGVLILTDVPKLDEWELSYLGVVPDARGNGLGRLLVRKAIALATRAANRLTVTVDNRNAVAKRLYHSEGFSIMEESQAWLLIFGEPAAISGANHELN